MQLEFDFFTPYHRILDLVVDRGSEDYCDEENPRLWYAFCAATGREPRGRTVWTVKDVADWANYKIRQLQGDK